jgi:cell division protein FtsI/penicillin-binding protein 2
VTALRVGSPGRVSTARLWFFAGAILIWATLVVVKLQYLQIQRSEDMRAMARRQQERVITADPRRGMILDRTGRQLAVSTDVYSVYAAPEEIENKELAAESLARELDVGLAKVRRRLSKKGFVLVGKRVEPAVADRIKAMKIPGVHLVTESRRFYPGGSLASHLLGFVIPGQPKMREGLEHRYDPAIKGTPGALVALRDAHGRHFLRTARQRTDPGQDIVTSVDEVIQHIAERELVKAIRESRSKAGTVIVQHSPTGEILALANYPDFNPNIYGKSTDDARRNRGVMDLYEPGSTFKIITAAAALEEGLVRPSEIINCEHGSIVVGGKRIRDHKSFGPLAFAESIALSSNVCTIKVGLRLSPLTFHGYIKAFGFGRRTGVDLPMESRGRVRSPAKWRESDQAYLSFGQGIGVTALQITSAYSTIANRGVAVAPRVVTRILQAEGKRVRYPAKPEPHRVIGESTANVLIDLMEGVVAYGTGKKAAVQGFRVAGKTGTAQKWIKGSYSPDKHVSSFAGFVPSRNAVLTIHVILDEPKVKEYHGGDIAAPVFAKIAAPVLEYLGVASMNSDLDRIELASMGAGRPGPIMDGTSGSFSRAAMGTQSRRSGLNAALRKLPQGVRPILPRTIEFNEGGGNEAGASAPGSAAEIKIPNLFGLPLRDAVIGLARAGLKAHVRGDGFVATQFPEPGSVLPRGSTVRIRLARLVVGARPQTSSGNDGGILAHDTR